MSIQMLAALVCLGSVLALTACGDTGEKRQGMGGLAGAGSGGIAGAGGGTMMGNDSSKKVEDANPNAKTP